MKPDRYLSFVSSFRFPDRLHRTAFPVLFVFLILSAFSPRGAAADPGYPSRPVEISIAFPPGGALDAVVRALLREAEKELGQPATALNTPGSGGVPAVAKLTKAAPDGSRLTACVSNALIFIPHRNAVPYHPLRDVTPILTFGQAAPLLVTAPDAPWNDLDDFLAATRENPGKLRIGVPGLGTPSHIALAMMARKDSSLKWRFVPFSGPGEAEAALLGGHVEAAASGALARVKQGQMRGLLALSGERLPALPALPSLSEKGFDDPGRGDSTFLLLAPAGTPDAVLDRLEQVFLEASRSQAFRSAMDAYSVSPALRGREEARLFLREAWAREGNILKELGMEETPATSAE